MFKRTRNRQNGAVKDVAAKISSLGGGAGTLDLLGKALGIGMIAGLRSATAPAVVTQAHATGKLPLRSGGPLGFLAGKRLARLSPINAVGEMIADKLPFLPSRLQPGPLSARLGIGAYTASAIYRGAGRSWLPGALCGAVGALAGAFAGNRARSVAVQKTGLPDAVFALAEDVLAVSGGYALLRRPKLGLGLFFVAAVAAVSLRPPKADA